MRGLLLGRRSVYKGAICMHCHAFPTYGQAIFGLTLYIRDDGIVSGQSWTSTNARRSVHQETVIRVVYHRSCVEAILANCPTNTADSDSQFEEYRAQILANYGQGEVEA